MPSAQAPQKPFQPYASALEAGGSRPTALQVVKDCNAIGELKGKTILITGCSSGIGVETARALYETGATLFLTARDIPKLNNVIDNIVETAQFNKAGPKPSPIEMHLDSLESVRKGTEDFKKKSNGRLNILINNAGVMACPYSKTVDGFERQIGTNHMSHFLLFQLVKPLLVASAKDSGTPSRVINVSSAGHGYNQIRFNDMQFDKHPEEYDKLGSYGQSKTANVYMASSISRHYASEGLIGLSLHPGVIWTELGRHFSEQDFEQLGGLEALKSIFISPEQGAATTVWAAVSPHFADVKNGGRYLEDVGESAPAAKDAQPGTTGYMPHLYDEEAEEKLWKVSCEAVGVPED